MVFQSPIAISLSPNTESDDVFLAFKLLFQPWKWKKGNAVGTIVEWFRNSYHTPYVFTYNSGRSALFHILQSFDIKKGDEVVVQSFTCVAVPNSVLWNGATPVYCDIDDQYNLAFEDLKKKVTHRTKAIIVQHTFGIPAEIDTIVEFAKKKNIVVIEDCAHALGGRYKSISLGAWGDAAIFSFGRDKVLSSVFGGVGIIAPSHKRQAEKLSQLHQRLEINNWLWIFQQLIHPVAFSLILPLYQSGIGKLILRFLQIIHVLSFPVYPMEKKAKQPGDFPALYPNALAILGYNQLQKLNRYNEARQKIAAYYREELKKIHHVVLPADTVGSIYLRYPFRIKNASGLLQAVKNKGILLGNWYHNVIDPIGTDFSATAYEQGFCPNAETVAQEVINLPTRITLKEAHQVINVIKYNL